MSSSFQIYQSVYNLVLKGSGLPQEVAALYGKFEKAFLPCISLVAEFGTNHIKKGVLINSGLVFSEIVGGMKLKFGK